MKLLSIPFFWHHLSRKKRAYLNLFIGAILVVLIPLALSTLRNPDQAQASWYNDNWAYRQTVALTNSGSDVTDFQISMTLDTATLITAGKMQSNCNDVRVVDINGKLLPHWVEQGTNGCNTATTAIWTKVPSISTNGTTVFIYYGSATATNTEDGNKVFAFFDDFTGSSLSSKWTTISSGSVTVSGGNARVTRTAGGDSKIAASYTPLSQSVVEFRGIQIMQSPSSRNRFYFGTLSGTTFTSSSLDDGVAGGNTDYGLFYDGANAPAEIYLDTWRDVNLDTTSTFNIKYLLHGSAVDAYYTNRTTNTQIYSLTNLTPTIANSSINALALQATESTTSDFKIDTVFIRQYAATEPSVASPTNEEKGTGPVGYWKFDDGTGTNAQDSTQQNNDGTISGATWQTEDQCISGKCLSFDGTNDFTYITSPASALKPTNLTVSAWIKANTLTHSGTTRTYIVAEQPVGAWGDGRGYQLYADTNGKAAISIGNAGGSWVTATGATTLSANTWYHLVGTYDGSTLKVYVNGQLDGTTNTSITISYSDAGGSGPSTQTFYVGAQHDNTASSNTTTANMYFFKGYIDDVKVYPSARTATQILTDYSSRGSVKGTSVSQGQALSTQGLALSNGLVGYWKMDETATPSVDSSGNGRSGTWNGSVDDTAGKFGNGMTFDGTGDYNSMGDVLDFERTDPFSISQWVKTASGGTAEFVVAKWDNGNAGEGYGTTLAATTGYVGFHLANHQTTNVIDVTGNVNVRDNTWHHVLVTYDGSSRASGVKIYTDGVLNTNTISNDSLSATTVTAESFQLGCRESCSFSDFNGAMDEVRIYNRALTSADATALYNFAPGPIGYWNMDENTGTSAFDKSGNGYTGTLTNTPVWSQGKYGSGLTFNGSSNYVTAGDQTALNATANFTVSAWVNKTGSSTGTSTDGTIAGKWNTAGAAGWFLEVGDSDASTPGQIRFFISGVSDTSLFSTSTVSNNAWHYITAKYDGVNKYIYIDGVLVASEATTGTPTTTTDGFQIGFDTGSGGTNNYFNGKIDDVKVYNYARTASQIVQDMNAGHPAPGSPVGSAIGHWKFDEGYGTTANNSGNAGSTLNGTMTGMSSPATATSGWTNTGKFAKALLFDGSDDYVTTPNNSSLNFTGDFTISTWVKTTQAASLNNWPMIVFKESSGGGRTGYELGLHNSNVDSRWYGTIYVSNTSYIVYGTSNIADGNWHHLVFQRSGSNIQTYEDGKFSNTATAVSTDLTNTYQFNIGMQIPNSFPFNGSIDEVKVYNSALTADQIKLDYNRSQAQVLGSLSDKSTYQPQAANQEYCIPGDTSTSCAAPIAEWKLDENQGVSANDTSGNGYIGTWNGTLGSQWKPGKIGSGGNFDGSTNYVDPANAIVADSDTVTVSLWVKPSTSGGAVFSRGRDGFGAGWSMDAGAQAGAVPTFSIVAVSGGAAQFDVSGTTVLSTNTWYHITCVWTPGSNIKIYVNGKLEGTTPVTKTTLRTSTKGFFIGLSNVPGYFLGQIDQVRVFNYARTAAQIAWDYNRGAPVGHWKFDECQGTIAHDSSGNGNNGTITPGSGGQTAVGTCTGSAGTLWKDGATGKYNSSLDFDGTDDYVTGSRILTAVPYTISAWINPSSYGADCAGKGIFYQGTGSSDLGTHLIISDCTSLSHSHTLALRNAGGSIIAPSNNIISLNTWQHITVTVDSSGNAIFYVNGISYGGGNVGTTAPSNNNYYIGTWYNTADSTRYFTGTIDDPKIYNYALTATQVKGLYNGGAVRFGPVTGAP